MAPGEHRAKTKAAYEADAAGWTDRTQAHRLEATEALRERCTGLMLDVGCGPGWHLPGLAPAVGVDLSREMTKLATTHGPVAQADMSGLPFARESFGGFWASRSLVHLPRQEVPIALAEIHRVLRTGAPGELWLFEGDQEGMELPTDSLPGRTFSYWPPELLQRTLEGAGFEVGQFLTWESAQGWGQIIAPVTRSWTLPDYVGPNMKLLICGLNPSPSSADNGVGFFKAGNRFWPAAIKAGLVTKDRDPLHALTHHGVGMTDMVKRATRRADELDASEYRQGFERVDALAGWLQPQAICMIGLAGWRAAVNRKAQRGWQPETLGGRPVYLMPSTSGLNAHDTVDTLTEHLQRSVSR